MKATRARIRLPLIAGIAALTIATAACGGQEPLAAASAAQGAAKKVAALPPHAARLIQTVESLKGLGAAQKTRLAALVADVKTKVAPYRPLRAEVLRLAAKQIRAGKIDRAAIDAYATKIHALMQGKGKALAAASLNKLHAILTPAQRKELVDKIRTHMLNHKKRRAKLQKLVKQVGLSSQQQDAIKNAVREQFTAEGWAGVKRRFERRKKMREAAQAFMSDSFDAKKLDFYTRKPRQMKAHMGRILSLAEKILPLLTQPQRDVVAGMLETKALQFSLGTQK